MIATIVSAAVLVGGIMVANSDLAPAHRGYVRAVSEQMIEERDKKLDSRVTRVETRQSATQLQVNQLRRDALEKEKFDLGLKQREATDQTTRTLIDQRLRQINDDLSEVNFERQQIRNGP